jgi:predicted 3-demethylubiquinone-9 3-methyltransferase (glyoxalase superfamily)
MTQKITPFLWFDHEAEEAANYYASIFRNSKIAKISRYPAEGAPRPSGSVMTVEFQLEGQDFIALNGGPNHPFTDAISLSVSCETQKEVDNLWEKLTAGGGGEIACGWLRDKYGLHWQITPTALLRLMTDQDRTKAARVMQAMMQMKKIDIAGLQRAYDHA